MYVQTPHYDYEKYKDSSRVSPSSLSMFAKCPYHYWAQRVAKFWEDGGNENFLLGGAADALITEGRESYESKYHILDRRTPQAKAKAEADGVELITPKQAETVERMLKELSRQQFFSKFQGEGWATQEVMETFLIDEFDGSKVQASGRLDFYHEGAQIIADLKTCANLETFRPNSYALQMGMYHEMAKLRDGINAQVFIIAVDKTDMQRSRFYLISDYVIQEGKTQMRNALERLKACREKDAWSQQPIDPEAIHSCPTYDTCPYGLQTRIFTV